MKHIHFTTFKVGVSRYAIFRSGVVIKIDDVFRDVAASLKDKGYYCVYVEDPILVKIGNKMFNKKK